ncbi:MAG: hypothetical protein ABFD92_16865 [Planctomycetaceae bacterium]|nr:hypothetical protein [Planctomycetaceae bacterium]
MAIPKFNNVELVTHGAQELLGAAEPRLVLEHMPGLDGQFVQPHGRSGRDIIVTGVVAGGVNIDVDIAMAMFRTSMETLNDLADGRTVAGYHSANNTPFTNCVVKRVEPISRLIMDRTAERAYSFRQHVRWTIRQLSI